jgi:hypothetical protein
MMTGSIALARCLAAVVAACLSGAAIAAEPAQPADGLTKVDSRRLDHAYVLPGADFRPYTAILLEPVDASFARNWQRDFNSRSSNMSARVSDADAARILAEAREGAAEVFARTFAKAGYRMADQPGPDVLRVKVAISDLRVTAPDVATTVGSRTFAEEAGSATMLLEVRDSVSGQLLGKAKDSRDVGDHGTLTWQRTAVSNRADFERAFGAWADAGVKALAELKSGGSVPAY